MGIREFDWCASQARDGIKTSSVSRSLLPMSALLLVLPLTCAGAPTQGQQKAPTGSLTSTGEVHVNGVPAPADSTIFAGDLVDTGQNGSATFTISGKGDLKISRQSQLVFSNGSQYAAELKVGTVVLDSSSGPAGVTLLAGSYVVVPAAADQNASARIDGPNNGAFRISCLTGTVALVALQGGSGQVLQAGEAVNVSPQGVSTASASSSHQKRWILLGVAGGGAVAGIAAAASHGKQSVSPSTP